MQTTHELRDHSASDQVVRETIRMMLLNAEDHHRRFGTDLRDELQRTVYDLLRSGAGAERILDVAVGISAHLHAEVSDAIDEVLYGPKRRFERPLYKGEGVDLEDPELVIAYTDAGCHPDPGAVACGAVILSSDGKELAKRRRSLQHVTSNEAEYEGVILALETALELGFSRIEVRSDSNLVVSQLNGEYALRSENLIPLYERVRQLMRRFRYVRFVHVPRERNERAHQLVHCAG